MGVTVDKCKISIRLTLSMCQHKAVGVLLSCVAKPQLALP